MGLWDRRYKVTVRCRNGKGSQREQARSREGARGSFAAARRGWGYAVRCAFPEGEAAAS
jgi:hypothetical protein